MAPRQAEDWKTHPNLKALGLRTSLIHADGGCLFSSLSDQIYGDDERGYEIRKKIVGYIRRNRAKFYHFMVVDGERRAPRRKAAAVASVDHKEVTTADFDRALDRYLEEMSRPSTFGDHAAMVAFTQCYSTDIRVFFKSSDYYVNVVEGSVSRKVAYIAYHDDFQHYDSIRKIGGSDSGLSEIGSDPPSSTSAPADVTADNSFEIGASINPVESETASSYTISVDGAAGRVSPSTKRARSVYDDDEEKLFDPWKRQKMLVKEKFKELTPLPLVQLKNWDESYEDEDEDDIRIATSARRSEKLRAKRRRVEIRRKKQLSVVQPSEQKPIAQTTTEAITRDNTLVIKEVVQPTTTSPSSSSSPHSSSTPATTKLPSMEEVQTTRQGSTRLSAEVKTSSGIMTSSGDKSSRDKTSSGVKKSSEDKKTNKKAKKPKPVEALFPGLKRGVN